MWIFWLYELLGFVAVIVLIAVYCHWRETGFWRFVWKQLKWVALAIAAVWLIIAILCWTHLYHATQCYFRGVSMKANTKYSMYFGECQIETPKGSFISIDRTRSLPDGSKSDGDSDADQYFGE